MSVHWWASNAARSGRVESTDDASLVTCEGCIEHFDLVITESRDSRS